MNAVVANVVAVVTREDYDGIVRELQIVELFQNASQLVVNRADVRVVALLDRPTVVCVPVYVFDRFRVPDLATALVFGR